MSCPKNVNKNELRIGIKIESEHYKSLKKREKIACDHLREFPHYYTQGLLPMEKKLIKLGRKK